MTLDVHSGLTKQQISPDQRASDTLCQKAEGAAFVNDDPKSVLRTFGHSTPDSHPPFADARRRLTSVEKFHPERLIHFPAPTPSDSQNQMSRSRTRPKQLWPFCGQSSHKLPLLATISCFLERTLRVSKRKRTVYFSVSYRTAAPAAESRLSDSQSSNPGSIPGSATNFF